MLKVYIERNLNENKYRLKMKGHCGFNQEGRDIVCSAASILCLAMAQTVKDNKDNLERAPRIVIHNGHATVEWIPKPKFEAALCNSLYTVKEGFRVLEHEYPDYVKIIEK